VTAGERLEKFAVENLTEAQLELYAKIADGPRAAGPQLFSLTDAAGSLEGPFNAMLLNPVLGTALQDLGGAIRYSGRLPDRAREIAILLVAYAWDSSFEVYAHEAVGIAAGLTPEDFAALRAGRFDRFTGVERAVAVATESLCARADLDDGEFASTQQELGAEMLFELTTLIGYYAALALQLRVFRVSVPD
jgi:4-carboxymuconolactone decarboxylase